MATAVPSVGVAQIGETAGAVWRVLYESGPVSMAKLVEKFKKMGQPRDTVMQALGWLAREDKIYIEEEGRKRVVSLR